MRFEGRDLKSYLQTVPPENLIEGHLYFHITYVDDGMLMPIINSLIFVGKNLNEQDEDKYYFQDLDSYSAGIRYETASPESPAVFHTGDIIKSIQTYEQALDELLRCFLRRRKAETSENGRL